MIGHQVEQPLSDKEGSGRNYSAMLSGENTKGVDFVLSHDTEMLFHFEVYYFHTSTYTH